jgi:hypothetical protein
MYRSVILGFVALFGFASVADAQYYLLQNTPNPIVSPETANAPNLYAIYVPGPLVVGYNSTAGASTYDSMVTANLTVTGTITNHYGMIENTINLLGTGTMAGELNVQKNYVTVPAGMTITQSGEAFEAMLQNNGTYTAGNWAGYTSGPINNLGGMLGEGVSYSATAQNNSLTANSYGTWIGFQCLSPSGSGTINNHQCFYNQDIHGEIINAGHYAARPDSGQPTFSTGCTANSRANDVTGIITQGASVTGCTVTFKGMYSTAIMCSVEPRNNNPVLSVTEVAASLSWTNSAVTGAAYTYNCMDGF